MTTHLVDKVVETRVGMIRDEISRFFPRASIEVVSDQSGRAVIRMLEEGSVIGMEFVETGSTWDDPNRQRDYYITLVNKCRLGVIVPIEHAMRARLRLLEFNQRWLFYYQVYSYDGEGNLKKVGRPFDDDGRPGIIGTMPGYV
jgi:hypothetical protein